MQAWVGVTASSSSLAAAIAVSAFAWFRFPPGVIVVAVCLYLRFCLSHRDVEELLPDGDVNVGHFTVCQWVQRFTRCNSTPRFAGMP
jgi:transposase-like protein